MNWKTILSLGNDLSANTNTSVNYTEFAGHILQINTGEEWNVFNCAEPTIDAVGLHRKIGGDFCQIKQYLPDFIMVLVGTEDAKMMADPANFAIAYRQILLKTKIISPEALIVALAIPAIQKGVGLPYFYSMNNIIETYNSIIEKLTAELNILFVRPSLNECHFLDGVHLNKNGNKILGEQMANVFLEKN